jgi:lysophospholipase L1-like esterase
MRSLFMQSACATLAVVLACAASASSRAEVVYLALGDSLTFGQDPSTPSSTSPSYGDQGFVKPFADFLATVNGGVRPIVANLAISGELSSSFFDANPPADWPSRTWQWNLNYPNGTTPQESLMQSTVAAAHAAGNSVGYVSVLLGANDLNYLTGTAVFQGASFADKQQMVAALLGQVQGNYLAILAELKGLAPEAKLLLPGYPNPYAALVPSDPSFAFYDPIVRQFNQIVAADAAAFGATYVDFYTPIAGRELELTNIGSGDSHPNQAGYALLAGQLRSAAVPEPGSLSLLASAGIAGLATVAARRRLARCTA